MPNWKAIAVGGLLSAVLPVINFFTFNVGGSAGDPVPPNLLAVLAAWLVALFAPGFFAGLIAKRKGWLYGGLLALVPIAFAALVGYEVPLVAVAVLWVVGFLGGSLGQLIGARRHAL